MGDAWFRLAVDQVGQVGESRVVSSAPPPAVQSSALLVLKQESAPVEQVPKAQGANRSSPVLSGKRARKISFFRYYRAPGS